MKRWKVLPLCMASAMIVMTPLTALAAQSPEFSRNAEEWEKLKDNVMEYWELEALVHEYNPVVLNNRLSYQTSDSKNKNSEEIADMLRDTARAARSAVDDQIDALGDLGNGSLADVISNQMEIQAKQLEMQADTNVTDDLVIRLQFEMAEKSIVSAVQGLMIQYNQMLGNKDVLEQSIELAKASYDSTMTRMNIGMATQADVLTAKQQVQSLESQLLTLNSGINTLRQNLCIMTGWAYDANPEIKEIPEVDFGRIDGMNLGTDIAKALENNYSLRVARRQADNTSFSYSDAQVLRNTIANNEQNLSTNVTKQYQAVLDARADYEASVVSAEAESKLMSAAEIKYQVGTIGRLEYLQQKVSYMSKQADKNSKYMALFQGMETYDWMIRGLGTFSQ